ncbi:transposase [Azospirillum brasilense]|nr:transposase [Azospirillum brasilense]
MGRGKRRFFTPDVKEHAVKLVREGKPPISRIAADLGIGESRLRRWRRDHEEQTAPASNSQAASRHSYGHRRVQDALWADDRAVDFTRSGPNRSIIAATRPGRRACSTSSSTSKQSTIDSAAIRRSPARLPLRSRPSGRPPEPSRVSTKSRTDHYGVASARRTRSRIARSRARMTYRPIAERTR